MNSTPEEASGQPCREVSTVMGILKIFVFCAVFLVTIGLSSCFIVISYVYLKNILTSFDKEGHTRSALEYMNELGKDAEEGKLESMTARIYLEIDAMRDRQERANYAVAARTWLRSVTVVFGSILILFGMIFVLSKIGDESSLTEMSGKDISLRASPGVVMIIIGALLMSLPHFSKQNISTRDGAIYVSNIEELLSKYSDFSKQNEGEK